MTASDEWRPSAAVETIRARAEMLARIRQFFKRIGVLEVETPVCSRYATTDPGPV
ncbi:MAG: hypothetical protein AB2707_10240 [Candidatus Thiodiazotropha sp.]